MIEYNQNIVIKPIDISFRHNLDNSLVVSIKKEKYLISHVNLNYILFLCNINLKISYIEIKKIKK